MTPPAVKLMKEAKFREPMAILPLRKYNDLIEYLEDLEDQLAVIERSKEPEIPVEEVEKKFKKKFGIK